METIELMTLDDNETVTVKKQDHPNLPLKSGDRITVPHFGYGTYIGIGPNSYGEKEKEVAWVIFDDDKDKAGYFYLDYPLEKI